MLGKALYDGMLVDSQLSITVLNALIGKRNQFDDLIYYDKQFYKSLKMLKQYARMPHGADELIDSLGLTFTASTSSRSGSHSETVELMDGGPTVTRDNIYTYIHKMANYKLNQESRQQLRALVNGFREMVDIHSLRMFSAVEIQMLIGGEKRAMDVEDLKKHCKYGSGYHPSQPYIQVSDK